MNEHSRTSAHILSSKLRKPKANPEPLNGLVYK